MHGQEKSVQLSASGVLEEVKKKKTDVQRLLGVADTLKELRSIRREASRKEGMCMCVYVCVHPTYLCTCAYICRYTCAMFGCGPLLQ